MKNYMAEILIVIALMFVSVAAHADTVKYRGQLEIVLADNGNGVYSDVPVGKHFLGQIDDQTAEGFITDGLTHTLISPVASRQAA